jgi:dTDP-4-dehydrorhamnose reductase
MKDRLLVTGATGLVGSRFLELKSQNFEVLPTDINTFDITNRESVDKFLNDNKPTAILHFAGYTDVDAAEKQRNQESGPAWEVNVLGTRNIAEAAGKLGIFMVHISTDFVFKGSEDDKGPYSEEKALPASNDGMLWYGWTKKLAEDEVRKAHPKAAIARISYPFRAKFDAKKDFARSILLAYEGGTLYPLFTDQYLTPSFIDDVSEGLSIILQKKLPGTFHLVCTGVVTPYEFGNYLLEKAKGEKNIIKPGSLDEFVKVPGRTPKPKYGGLLNEKTEVALGMKFMTWKEAIDELVNQINAER